MKLLELGALALTLAPKLALCFPTRQRRRDDRAATPLKMITGTVTPPETAPAPSPPLATPHGVIDLAPTGRMRDADLEPVWRELIAMGCADPEKVPRASPLRKAEPADVSAKRLVQFLGITRGFPICSMTAAELLVAYASFCRIDHRKPASVNHVLGVVAKLPNCRRREVEGQHETGAPRYTRYYDIGVRRKLSRRTKIKAKRVAPPSKREVEPLRLAA